MNKQTQISLINEILMPIHITLLSVVCFLWIKDYLTYVLCHNKRQWKTLYYHQSQQKRDSKIILKHVEPICEHEWNWNPVSFKFHLFHVKIYLMATQPVYVYSPGQVNKMYLSPPKGGRTFFAYRHMYGEDTVRSGWGLVHWSLLRSLRRGHGYCFACIHKNAGILMQQICNDLNVRNTNPTSNIFSTWN